MSEPGPEGAPKGKSKRDPVFRFLVGCALVIGGLGAIVAVVGGIAAWRILRDPAPGRSVESFRSGDESGYACIDLKPDDKGVQALLDQWSELNDRLRRQMLERSGLGALPLPRQRVRLSDIAPLKVELALWEPVGSAEADSLTAWAARGTFSKGVLRMRFVVWLLGWMAGRDKGSTTVDIDGVPVTEIRPDDRSGFVLTMVANRILVANDRDRVERILESATSGASGGADRVDALHRAVALPGEDAWVVRRDVLVDVRDATPHRAVASYDIDEKDGLALRIAVEGDAGDDRARLAAWFLPAPLVQAMTFEADAGATGDGRPWLVSGRIDNLSERLAALAQRLSSESAKKQGRAPTP